jgi:hypothetical protein
VIDRFHGQLERKLDATDTLSTDMTSYALASGSEFPFVTVPDFAFKGANARIAGDTVMTFYMPYITEDLKAPWITYAAANHGHDLAGFVSENVTKIAQDKMFGLVPPQIDGLALDYIKLNALNQPNDAGFDTSIIWYTGNDNIEVSKSVFSGEKVSSLALTTILRVSRRGLPTSHFGTLLHRYRWISSI